MIDCSTWLQNLFDLVQFVCHACIILIQGFDTHGTEISKKRDTLKNIYDMIKKGHYSLKPDSHLVAEQWGIEQHELEPVISNENSKGDLINSTKSAPMCRTHITGQCLYGNFIQIVRSL